jgi:hypothetical protein
MFSQRNIRLRGHIYAGFFVAIFCISASSVSANIGWAEVTEPSALIEVLSKKRCATHFGLSNSGKTVYCLKTKIALPKAEVTPHCESLEKGTISFSWQPKKGETGKYACPKGSKLTRKKKRWHCEFTDLFIPANVKAVRPYCTYVTRGYFGYSYQL